MRSEFNNLKPLLLRWAVICIVAATGLASVIINAASPAISAQNSEVAIPATKPRVPPKPATLPPYSAEIDHNAPPPPEVRVVSASSAGNSYTRGNCTWYAKSNRPDLPNNLGNANTWVARAKAQGLPTGAEPQVGAVGQRGMHVVYVERINDDGTVFISEMNWRGLGKVSTRTVPANSFKYIY